MNSKLRIKNKDGFIALMSAIIISFLLLAITISLGFSSFFSRFNILDSESKERSSALAEACADTAILKLTQNSAYNPVNECNSVGDVCPSGTNVCKVISVTASGSNKIIHTQAVINKAYTNLEVIIDSNYVVASWQELTHF